MFIDSSALLGFGRCTFPKRKKHCEARKIQTFRPAGQKMFNSESDFVWNIKTSVAQFETRTTIWVRLKTIWWHGSWNRLLLLLLPLRTLRTIRKISNFLGQVRKLAANQISLRRTKRTCEPSILAE
ncbi:unnamed protein product [Nesidiocoris tenuis]|uniref:Uncharacterized protein n=1 Tax=Nesidiocoris tenuis TaxID=355587 RepID=A0A6H5GJH0_9HEMI|nr:unnamed protein product [Nesidiocoris tenuis]